MILELLNMLKVKSNIKVIVVEKVKIGVQEAMELASNIRLEISHYQKRYNVKITTKKTV